MVARKTQLRRRQTRPARCARHRHHLSRSHLRSDLQTQTRRAVVDAQNGHAFEGHGLEITFDR